MVTCYTQSVRQRTRAAWCSRVARPRRSLPYWGGDHVRSFELGGMGVDEAQALLVSKHLVGGREHWAELTARFGGNGLALQVVGERIRELFGGDIAAAAHRR